MCLSVETPEAHYWTVKLLKEQILKVCFFEKFKFFPDSRSEQSTKTTAGAGMFSQTYTTKCYVSNDKTVYHNFKESLKNEVVTIEQLQEPTIIATIHLKHLSPPPPLGNKCEKRKKKDSHLKSFPVDITTHFCHHSRDSGDHF